MRRTKLLPTNTPMPIPQDFIDKFVRHGWRRCEHMWGKSTVKAWKNAIGTKRLVAMRQRFKAEQEKSR